MLRQALQGLIPGFTPDRVSPTPIEGIYQAHFGTRIFYFSADGRYLLRGDLIDVGKRVNLTEQARRQIRLDMLGQLTDEKLVVFGPEKPRHVITVFTDVECPYCARFHQEVPRLAELGVKVRYAAFPRRGLDSAGYRKMVAVWCAADPREAITRAKAGEALPEAQCENPVAEEFGIGHAIGVTGTPSIVLETGELIRGYVPYRRLFQILEESGS